MINKSKAAEQRAALVDQAALAGLAVAVLIEAIGWGTQMNAIGLAIGVLPGIYLVGKVIETLYELEPSAGMTRFTTIAVLYGAVFGAPVGIALAVALAMIGMLQVPIIVYWTATAAVIGAGFGAASWLDRRGYFSGWRW